MKILQQEILYLPKNSIENEIFTESSVFFDIETTGFSAKHSFVYLIGCAYRQQDHLMIHQFFAEKKSDEPQILHAFFELVHQFKTLITFNGLGFDIPYLQTRCSFLHISMDLSALFCIDLFKILAKYKHIIKLNNLKQKTLEQFLGIERKDLYTGGELINLYFNYLKMSEGNFVEESCRNEKNNILNYILLHNAEDLSGMTKLLPLLSYAEFFQGSYTLEAFEKLPFQEYNGSSGKELILSLKSKHPFPKRISCGYHSIYLSGYHTDVKLKAKIYQGELKFFYSNYRDYYYLPDEDVALHKSVAFYVDKEFRTQAKAATCYSKKTGHFLPQFEAVFEPYFKREYKDTYSYFEMTCEVRYSFEAMNKYVNHLLSYILKA